MSPSPSALSYPTHRFPDVLIVTDCAIVASSRTSARPQLGEDARINPTWHIIVNDREATVTGAADDPLIFALRNELGLVATRLGCGLEQCGACRIRLDDELTWACTTTLDAASGRHVTTLEGLQHDSLMDALRHAFAARNAAQCGYCATGVLMAAYALLDSRRGWTRDELSVALDTQLCRCGSQHRMLEAILAVDADG